MTLDSWLEAHPYLRPLAELSAEVDRAAAEIEIPEAPVPDWDDYRSDFLAGVTLLQSADAAVDLDPGGRTAAALIERLALAGSSGWLAAGSGGHLVSRHAARARHKLSRFSDSNIV